MAKPKEGCDLRVFLLTASEARCKGSLYSEETIMDADHVFVLDDEDLQDGEDECNLLKNLYDQRSHFRTITLVATPVSLEERQRASSIKIPVKKRRGDGCARYLKYRSNCVLGCLYWYPKSDREAAEGAELMTNSALLDRDRFLGEGSKGRECLGDVWILKTFEDEERTSRDAFPLPYAAAKRLVTGLCDKKHHVVSDLCGSLYTAASDSDRDYFVLRSNTAEDIDLIDKVSRTKVARDRRLKREKDEAEARKSKRQAKKARADDDAPQEPASSMNLPPFDPAKQYVLTQGQRTLEFAKAPSNQ